MPCFQVKSKLVAGDCIPLTAQSFGKISFSHLILILLVTIKRIHSSFKSFTAIVFLLIVTAGTSVVNGMFWNIYAGGLPYKRVTIFAEQVKRPPVQCLIVFLLCLLQKMAAASFDQSNFPAIDSTYTYIDGR